MKRQMVTIEVELIEDRTYVDIEGLVYRYAGWSWEYGSGVRRHVFVPLGDAQREPVILDEGMLTVRFEIGMLRLVRGAAVVNLIHGERET